MQGTAGVTSGSIDGMMIKISVLPLDILMEQVAMRAVSPVPRLFILLNIHVMCGPPEKVHPVKSLFFKIHVLGGLLVTLTLLG